MNCDKTSNSRILILAWMESMNSGLSGGICHVSVTISWTFVHLKPTVCCWPGAHLPDLNVASRRIEQDCTYSLARTHD